MKKYKLQTADGKEIIFRLLSVEETDSIVAALLDKNNPDLEEYLFNLITDSKYDILSLNAGLVTVVNFCSLSLSGYISGLKDVPRAITEAREAISNNGYSYFYKTIIQTQPSYTLDQLKKKTLKEMLELFAFSELITGKEAIDISKIGGEATPKKDRPKGGVSSITPGELDGLMAKLNQEEAMSFTEDGLWIGEGVE